MRNDSILLYCDPLLDVRRARDYLLIYKSLTGGTRGGGGEFSGYSPFRVLCPHCVFQTCFRVLVKQLSSQFSFTMMPFKWSLTFVALNEHLQVHVLTLFFKWDSDYDRVSAALMINQSSNKGRWEKIRGTWSCRSYCTSPSNTEIISHIT